MRTILAILAMSATSATARNDNEAKKPVKVYIEHNAAMATGTLSLAQAISREMFRTVNVDLRWQTGRPMADAIVVEITTKTSPTLHPGALAYAEPFEGEHIRVFYDRLENMAGEQLAPRLLAHVFVHEITHILEELDRHSPTGVMKAHWTVEDVAGMARRPLSFDAADVALIKVGLDHRNGGTRTATGHSASSDRRVAIVKIDNMIAGEKTALAEPPQMNVALCSLGSVRESVITQGKTEAEHVFGSAGVRIAWHDCDSLPNASEQAGANWFVVRLRTDDPPVRIGTASLDVMGKAFVAESGRGSMADVYVRAIEASSEQYSDDCGVLLGFVVAHELGHLLLGPGHAGDGVMQASWGKRQMNALRQRWLRFNPENADRIRRALDNPAVDAHK